MSEVSDVICLCGSRTFKCVFTYTAPPEGEIRFRFSSSDYRRFVSQCETCGHFLSTHHLDMTQLYSGEYVDSTYGHDGIRKAFERIVSLDPEKSDNAGRVRRILAFADGFFGSDSKKPSILDVGSGLCIFLNAMKAAGWDCTALDPDIRAAEHARDTVGVRSVCGDLATLPSLGRFDVVTFNKVLEHVRDPISMLAYAKEYLNDLAFVYVELPDGEAAVVDGPGREEFFIDHWHIFSAASFAVLASRAGFRIKALERLREPSSKYTLRGFMTPAV